MDYMDRELHEECGVFGIIGHQDASQICYYGLHSLQHRGQEAAGICCENNGKMIFHKGEGLVTEVFNQDKLKELQGNSAIGHVRYSTAGGGGIANVQPFVFRTMQGSIIILIKTTVAPTGVENNIDNIIPTNAPITDKIAE